MSMINLDDQKAIIATQGGDKVLNSTDALPLQLNQSFSEATKIIYPEKYKQIKNVVICGMGGSRFPALINYELFKDKLTVPLLVNDNYELPGFVDKNTLVVLSSYSGTTEEVIACGKKAYARKALLTGLCVGGEIAGFLKETKNPVYVFNPIYNTSGQPRIGFGYGVGGQLGLLVNLGLIKVQKSEIENAISEVKKILRDFQIDVKTVKNPAKKLAKQIYSRYPYYLVSEFVNGVGNAFANQTNETAKSISSFRVIPELNHHLMEGLKFPVEHKKMAIFILFFSKLYSRQIQKRFKITKEVIEQNKIETVWYELKGKSKISQVFELMGLGSYTSMYLAALYDQDPTIIPYVDYFKKKLKEMK